jgi:hypothetical protein
VCDANKIVVKNCKITPGQATSYALCISPRISATSVQYISDSITVQNCSATNTSTSGQGLALSTSVATGGTQSVYPTGIVFLNNTVSAKSRGIFLNGAGNTDVIGNTFNLTQAAGYEISGIWGYVIGAGSTVNISKNKFSTLSSSAIASGFGIQAIACQSNTGGTYNINDNYIGGFVGSGGTGTGANFYAIYGLAGPTYNIYHNSINMPNLTIGANVLYRGIFLPASGTLNVKDNSVALAEDDFKAYCIYSAATTTTGLTSNYNNFYKSGSVNSKIGYWNAGDLADLSAWQTALTQDANSISLDPGYTNATDLSVGVSSPLVNAGLDVGIATDIMGNTRVGAPDIGAFEYQPAPAPPIPTATAATNASFTSFTANWTASAGATSYQLDVANDNGFTSFVAGYNNLNVGNVTSYSVTGLNDNAVYYYRVRSYNGAASDNSGTITVGTVLMTSYSGTITVGTAGSYEGSDPAFSSLRTACDSLNNGKITGDLTVYITSNLTEPNNVALGVNTNGHIVTFKPYTATTPTIHFTQLADNGGPSGLWIIGSRSLDTYSLVPTSHVVIDGSNTNGGTTRDLSITNVDNTPAWYYGLRVIGASNYVTIKNLNLTATEVGSGSTSSFGISFAARNDGADRIPNGGVVENCNIDVTQTPGGQAIAISPSSTPGSGAASKWMKFKDNTIAAATRGVFINCGASYEVSGNTIQLTQTMGGFVSEGVYSYASNGVTTNDTNLIYNNKFNVLHTANALASSGITAIMVDAAGIHNIYNNMICGFDNTAATSLGIRSGIRLSSTSATTIANVYYNTILSTEDADITASDAGGIAAIQIPTGFVGTAVIKNNILAMENNAPSYGIYRPTTGGTVTLNHNCYYTPGAGSKLGNWGGVEAADLASWQTASSQDANSSNFAPTFVSATDLHLSGGSIGNGALSGEPIAAVTTDIDGETRLNPPYMGADENVANPLPVELTSFAGTARGKSVQLNWATATEKNNAGFEVERKQSDVHVVNGATKVATWEEVAFVRGNGTSNAQHQYAYTDQAQGGVTYQYRLKQFDQNGSFKYSSQVEVHVGLAPEEYGMSQNYPNPFNPTTNIRFAVKTQQHVSLKVYNTVGQLVRVLFSDNAEADVLYTVNFDASALASGIYFSVLETKDAPVVKKMQLVK